MSEEKLSFEAAMNELEKTANALKSENVSLEDALKLYENGIKLYDRCKEILTDAKQKIETYSK